MEKINHTVNFPVSPDDFYKTILNAKKHSLFTQSVVNIDARIGSTFSAYDGYIEGSNLQLITGKLIVQSWKAYEENWPEDHFSKIIFRISPATKGYQVEFTHEDIPDGMDKMFDIGWKENYWKKLQAFFSNQK